MAGNLQEVPLSLHEPAADVHRPVCDGWSDVRGPGLEDGAMSYRVPWPWCLFT